MEHKEQLAKQRSKDEAWGLGEGMAGRPLGWTVEKEDIEQEDSERMRKI